MKRLKPSLDPLNELLRDAVNRLDRAALEIRDIPLEPLKRHIRKIGEALSNIFEIQQMIYDARPDLEPEYLKRLEPLANPEANRAWGNAMTRAVDLEEVGDIDEAIRMLESFISTTPPIEYVDATQAHIARLKKTYKKRNGA